MLTVDTKTGQAGMNLAMAEASTEKISGTDVLMYGIFNTIIKLK